jgi:8-oxo-dGTP diphosphatase
MSSLFWRNMPKQDQGMSSDRYQIIPRTLIFIIKEDKVLLLKGAPTKRIWANQFNGIGGHIEKGEDVRQAALRELKEETGLIGADLKLCATIMIDAGELSGIGIFVFRGNDPMGELQNSDEGSLCWIPIAELQNYPLVEDLPVILPEILKLLPKEEPLSILYTFDEQDKLVIKIHR